MLPRVCFACVRYGEPEKVYLERQVEAFTRVSPHILAWQDHRAASAAHEPLSLVGDPWEGTGSARLRRRMARFAGGDEHTALGAERDRLAHRIREIAPDVIYAHMGFVGLRLLPIAKSLGLPIVTHFHGVDIHQAWRNPRLARHLFKGFDGFDRVIVVGNYMERWIREQYGGKAEVVVIPMGAPIPAEDAGPPDDDAALRILSVGRLVAYKGFDRAIDAVAAVRGRFPNVQLRIVGDGPLRGELAARVARLGLQQHVTLLGERSPEQTQREFEWCDLLLHPASDDPDGPEASGVVITEAMAHGRPVLATICGGIPDQVISGETGILVPQHDEHALRKELEALLADGSSRLRLGKAARAVAVERLDARRLARRVEDVLLDVVHARSRG